MTEQTMRLAEKPSHVPEHLVRDFDFFNIDGSDQDVQAAYRAVQQANPDIFWTPHNGGHWVATRGEDIMHMQRTPSLFSNRRISVPEAPKDAPHLIPIELDPPVHAQYRRPLMQALTPSVMRQLEDNVRRVAIDQIEHLAPLGGCEFIEDFSKVLPINVFMDLVDLPRTDKDYLLPIAEVAGMDPSLEKRQEASRAMRAYLLKWVRERRENPGSDLLSRVVSMDIDGQRIAEDDAVSYATLLLFGGLDTTAAMLGFFARFLADHPDHRRRVVENLHDERFLDRVIEELLRRHGLSNVARVAHGDFEYKGVSFRDGDLIMPPNLFVGIDDRLNPDPLTVDFDRQKAVHAMFGNGPHACPGAILARREFRVFLQEWLARIPDFRVKPGTKPVTATGHVNGLLELQLVWP